IGFLGSFVSILVTAYVVFAMQTLRTEEATGRADAVLATAVSRSGWLGTHLAVVALGATLIMLITGLGTGLAAAGVTAAAGLIPDVMFSRLAGLPAVLAVLGMTAACLGVARRLMAMLVWRLVA